MHAALRPYATAGVALVGASIIAVTPIAPTASQAAVRSADVALTASSIANVPANAFLAVLNTPANMVFGIQRFADAMAASGSWGVSQPNNVWGWDPANPEMLKGFVDMLLPFPALSRPLGEQLNWWAAANLPMHEGCAFECPDWVGMLNSMFRVPMWKFYSKDGYTFGEVINPVDGVPTDWSGQTVKLDPLEPIKSIADYFLGEPEAFHPVTLYDFVTAGANLATALQITGHLPPWLAVRDVETFVKLFLPKPEHPAVDPVDYPGAPSAEPTTQLTKTVTLDVAKTEDTPESTVQENVSAQPSTDVTTAAPESAATDKTTAVGTTDAAAADVVTTATDPEPAESTDDESSTAAPSEKASATEGHKGSFSLKTAAESLQKKFAAANEKASETKSAKAGKSAKSAGSGATHADGSSSSAGASGSKGGAE